MFGEIYSKRRKRLEKANKVEVYQYDDLPMPFRRQVVLIWLRAIGSPENAYNSNTQSQIANLWSIIHNLLCRELGRFELSNAEKNSFDSYINPLEQCQYFLLDKNNDIENILDLVEVTFRVIDTLIRSKLDKNTHYLDSGSKFIVRQSPDDAIKELNIRFREHSIGYEYSEGQIIRVDSSFLHAEAVVPALTLLSSRDFEGAEQEFKDAHKHYRAREYRDAIVDAQNAFESTMKTICDRCNWPYSKKAAAKELIGIVLGNELVPKFFQDHFNSLQKVLENGVPTVRNKTSAHGQGERSVDVPDYLAAFALHLTASNIVLLVEAYESFDSGNSPSLSD